MSLCQCVSVSVCQCVSVSVCQCVSVSVCQCVNVSVCQCVSVSVCQCVSVSVCQCVSASVVCVRFFLSLPLRLSNCTQYSRIVCGNICWSHKCVCVYVCMCVCVYVCMCLFPHLDITIFLCCVCVSACQYMVYMYSFVVCVAESEAVWGKAKVTHTCLCLGLCLSM